MSRLEGMEMGRVGFGWDGKGVVMVVGYIRDIYHRSKSFKRDG